jgi:hypothetical protein
VKPRIRDFIQSACPQGLPASERAATELDGAFRELALELFRAQLEGNPAYARLAGLKGGGGLRPTDWRDIPAVSTHAFKELELTCLREGERTTVFHSSGTTEQRPSRHFHNADSLDVYGASLLPWFERHVLGEMPDLVDRGLIGPLDRPAMISLTPEPGRAPHSSLAHMMGCVFERFGARDSVFAGSADASGGWQVDWDRLLFALRRSMCANRPVWILGTAFHFVHLIDHFAAGNIRYRLAEGSTVMETGGYKGRSRALSKEDLHAGIHRHLGIPRSRIVCEYGMSELSSQAYDTVPGGEERPRVYRFPPWARASVVSPETGREVAEGEAGILTIVDLANVASALAVQTEDIARRRGDGFELVGRAAAAEPRGCSLLSIPG